MNNSVSAKGLGHASSGLLLATTLGVAVGTFSAVAEDAFWINTKTDTSAGNHYNSDQYVVGKQWSTAANWLGGVAPVASVDTVRFTNLVENGVGWDVKTPTNALGQAWSAGVFGYDGDRPARWTTAS